MRIASHSLRPFARIILVCGLALVAMTATGYGQESAAAAEVPAASEGGMLDFIGHFLRSLGIPG